MPRNYLRGPAINVFNLGVFKNTNVTEQVKLQFRAELFNALNHPTPGYGDGSLAGDSIPDIFIGDASFEGSAFADRNDMTIISNTHERRRQETLAVAEAVAPPVVAS